MRVLLKKRWAAVAAQRQYAGYQLLENRWQAKYNKKLGEGCPKMKSDLDQTVYLMGMLSGLRHDQRYSLGWRCSSA